MRLARTLAAALALALLPASGCAFLGRRDLVRQELEHGGLTREYYLKEAPGRPSTYPGIVLALHGGGGRARRFAAGSGMRLEELAGRDGYLVVYPQGVDRRWNDGRVDEGLKRRSRAHREGVDDAGFLVRLVRELEARYRVPPRNVYVCGISNGGRMTLRLILEHPAVFRAAGVVAMSLGDHLWEEHRRPGPPVPVAFLHGTEDPLVPYDGGNIVVLRRVNGTVVGAPESAARFAEAYGCSREVLERVPDRDPEDGTRTERRRYLGCRAGAEVVLDSNLGGGHTWPGGRQYLPRFLVGGTVRDYDGSEMLWDFWSRHGLGAGGP
jgi:polyhydroxybutyrate depolymerase